MSTASAPAPIVAPDDPMPPLPPWADMTPALFKAYAFALFKYRILHVSWVLLVPIVLTLLAQRQYVQAALAVVCGMLGLGLNEPAAAQFAVRREHARALSAELSAVPVFKN